MKQLIMISLLVVITLMSCEKPQKQPFHSLSNCVVMYCDSITPSRERLKDVQELLINENKPYIPLYIKVEVSDSVRYVITFQRVDEFNN